ncbi:MAG: phosphoribosylpyrophosphate synthetase [Candidatus Puniceispirillum sp.]|nr:phosphoribosylpyrophosphate synthetase [Candidatus Puniceispirillum sp.]
MKLIAGNSNKPLALAVSKALGVPLTEAVITTYSDKEIFVEIQENMRGEDVFILQSTSYPANDHLMELLLTIDALRRSSARRITAVIPYYGYARQDRKFAPRTPIAAKLVANLLTQAGAHRVLTFDLHATQIQGFFDIPVDNLFASPVFCEDIAKHFPKCLMVSPDMGGVVRTRAMAKRLGAEIAIIDKRRERAGVAEVMHIVGNVAGRHCVLLDDIVDSGGTLCKAAKALMEEGALSVSAYAIHGVLSGSAVESIMASALETLVITDSIQAREDILACPKIRHVSIAPLLAEAIDRVNEERSVSCLFAEEAVVLKRV